MKNIELGLGLSLLSLSLVAGCGAGAPEDGESLPEGEVSSVQQAVSVPDVCDVLDAVGTVDLTDSPSGSVTFATSCKHKSAKSLTYFGGTAPKYFSKSLSKVEGQALYCALKGADGAAAYAREDTVLGRFGTKAQIEIYKSDPAAMKLSGQRAGAIYAFGVGMYLESQTFDWSFPSEAQPKQAVNHLAGNLWIPETIPAQTGQYASVTTNGFAFGVTADAKFRVGAFTPSLSFDFHSAASPLVRRDVEVGSRFPFTAGDQRAYVMSGTGDQQSVRADSWDTMMDACNACLAHPQTGPIIIPCPCPSETVKDQHRRQCGTGTDFGCTSTFYNDLDDGRLPHENRLGASGPYNDGDVVGDYWHFGNPGAGAMTSQSPFVEGEPSSTIKSNGDAATMSLDLQVGLAFEAGPADIGVKVMLNNDYRNGIAVREGQRPSDLGSSGNATEVGIDAEAAYGVAAQLDINVDIPFAGTKNVLHEEFDILKRRRKQSSDVIASFVHWDGSETNAELQSYNVRGATKDINDTCLAVPAAETEPLTVSSPADFVSKVKESIENTLYPCNVTLCTKDSSTSSATTKRTCTWDASTKSLSCKIVGHGCDCMANTADLCDGAGNVYESSQDVNVTYAGCFDVPR